VFSLYLENLNWVSNAQTASGPTPTKAPVFEEFRRGIQALQMLQDRGQIVFGTEERTETLGGPLPAANVSGRDLVEAAKSGYEYRLNEAGTHWALIKRSTQPVLLVDPRAVDSPEMAEATRVFRLKRGLARYAITQEALSPFPETFPPEGVTSFDVETRSLLQALYYVSHGIDIPAEHMAAGLVTVTRYPTGEPFDWSSLTEGLFRVRSVKGPDAPANAHVAVPYRGYWFYVEDTDQETKATFSFLMELSRLQLAAKPGERPVLTLPISGR
jgi:hypothetical protein